METSTILDFGRIASITVLMFFTCLTCAYYRLLYQQRHNRWQDTIFLMFKSTASQFFTFCFVCLEAYAPQVPKCNGINNEVVVGTRLTVTVKCSFGHKGRWSSQPVVKNRPKRNIKLATSLLFSGCIIDQSLSVFHHMDMSCFSSLVLSSQFSLVNSEYGGPTVPNHVH